MCLVTDWDKPQIAKEDIECYKWCIKVTDRGIFSPYLWVRMPKYSEIGYSYLDEPRIANSFEKGFIGIYMLIFGVNIKLKKASIPLLER